ncbi:unnamed protein product [Chrysodeixis includens]|uniref:Uncharacterized protein n=1 Tax=Chrysodeixis includens TaxID=689277 RepID=A0A9P0FP60_CHRIL|nr:unnamed protein product [Chrysodeixis includens]
MLTRSLVKRAHERAAAGGRRRGAGARRGGRGARGGGGGARGGRARRHLRACPCPRIAQWGRAFRPKWPGPDNNYEEFKVKPRVSFLCSLLMQAVKVVMVDPSSTYEESVLALFIMNALFKQELYSTWTGTVTVTPADLPGLQRLAAGAADRPDVREQFYALLLRAPYRFLTIDPGLKRLERISRDPTASEDDVSKAKKQCRLLLGVMTLRDNRHKTLKRFEEGCDSYLATLFDLDTRSESAMSIVGDEPASVSGDDNDNSQPEPGPSGMARVEPGPSGQLSSVQMIKKRAMESPVKPVRAYVSIHDRKRKQSPLSDSSSPPSSLEDDDDD